MVEVVAGREGKELLLSVELDAVQWEVDAFDSSSKVFSLFRLHGADQSEGLLDAHVCLKQLWVVSEAVRKILDVLSPHCLYFFL